LDTEQVCTVLSIEYKGGGTEARIDETLICGGGADRNFNFWLFCEFSTIYFLLARFGETFDIFGKNGL